MVAEEAVTTAEHNAHGTCKRFGPIPPQFNSPHFYTLPGVVFGTAMVNGVTVATASFTLNNGALGDGTDASDGTIVDPGGPARATLGKAPVPVVSNSGLAALVVFLSAVAAIALWRQRRRSA